MKRAVFAFLLVASVLCAADKKSKPSKLPDVEVMEITIRRSSGLVTLDGRVKNCGEKPIQGLVLLFDFLAPGKQVITTKKAVISEDVMEPGDEGEFLAQTVDPVRAVHVVVNSEDGQGRYLRVERPGPVPIE